MRAGPGLDILVAGRAGPHNSICGPGPGRVFATAAGPGRAWASNHICGPGLGLDFRPVQDTSRLNVRLKGDRDQVSVPSVVRSAGSSSAVREGSRTRGKQSVRPAGDDGTDRILFPSPGSVGAGFR